MGILIALAVVVVLGYLSARLDDRKSRNIRQPETKFELPPPGCWRCGALLEGSQIGRGTCAPCSVRKFT